MRKAFECHFHDEAQVREYVQGALRALDGLDVQGRLREIAFGKAVDLLAQKQVTFEQVSPSGVLLNNGLGR
jgi:hypothetical protein